MINTFETGLNVQKWTGAEHFKNPLTTVRERRPFATCVREYVALVEEAFPRKKGGDSTIPLDGTDVSDANIPLLTQLVAGLQQEVIKDGKAFSLAVVASHGFGSSLCLTGMRDGEFYCGLYLTEQDGNISLGTRFIQEAQKSLALNTVQERLRTEIFSGSWLNKDKRSLQVKDKLFKFIVSQTLEQVQDKFS